MKTPREFWILGYDYISGSSLAYEDLSKCPNMKENMIHVLEIMPGQNVLVPFDEYLKFREFVTGSKSK